MQVSPITNHLFNKNSSNLSKTSFQGHWETRHVGCTYPHEEITTTIHTYVADPNESINEIAENFAKRSGTKDFLGRELTDSQMYTTNENYFTDLSKSLEVKKMRLTQASNWKIEKGEFVEAVKDKLEIANILKKQQKEKDKFLTEEGIRKIYTKADYMAKSLIEKLVATNNPDMAKDLFRHFK